MRIDAAAGGHVAASRRVTPRALRRLQMEFLESRLALASLTLEQAFGEMSGHPGVCSCPICTGQGLESLAIESTTALTADVAAAPLSSLPQLHSNSGASAKLFLDFDGHFESFWGGHNNVNTPAFDQDGNRSSFSDGELAAIREIWARVAEDYAPFNIDVTTVDPGNQTDRVTAVIAIGGNYSDWYGGSAGGVAFVGGFASTSSNVGYVFEDALGSNAKYVAEAAAHEAGHLFGLRHQSVWSGTTLVETYNNGDGDWAPLMGSSYAASRSTWHNGPTNLGPTTFQDDVAIISGSNNAFGYKADDHASTTAAAGALPVSGSAVSVSGLIHHTSDVDVWKFTTGGGSVNLALGVAEQGANLDSILELRDGSGNLVAGGNSTSSFGASLSANVGAGTFYVLAKSSGQYGSLGQYTITGSLPGTTNPPPPPPSGGSGEIALEYRSSNLADGGTADFGSTPVGAAIYEGIAVTNSGSQTLTLSNIDGSKMPAGFTLTRQLGDLTLSPGESTSFAVRLDADAAGTYDGTFEILSSDGDENPFDIRLAGAVQGDSSGSSWAFDFGTADSPVEAGYERVASGSSYNASAGFGWSSGTITGRDRGRGTAITRDFDFTQDGTFFVDVPNGDYQITVVMGDATNMHDQMGVYLEGALADTVTTAANQFVTRTYAVTVADGQLTVRLRDLGGSDANVVLNAITISGGGGGGGQTSNAPTIQSLSASPSVVSATGSLTLTASGVADQDGDLSKVRFYRDANGNGTLETGTDALLGQDQDGSNGWSMQVSASGLAVGTHKFFAVADDAGGLSSSPVSATATVENVVSVVSRKYDFGTASSALEAGYTRVDSGTSYTASGGFGWSSGTIAARDRGWGTAITRDFNFTQDGTFLVNLPSGTYDVTLVMGDLTNMHDQMGVYLEGALAATVTTAANQYVTRTYQVSVTDGQLTLRLRDLGGADANVVLNAVTIETSASADLSEAIVAGASLPEHAADKIHANSDAALLAGGAIAGRSTERAARYEKAAASPVAPTATQWIDEVLAAAGGVTSGPSHAAVAEDGSSDDRWHDHHDELFAMYGELEELPLPRGIV